jgi:hypothetical protein
MLPLIGGDGITVEESKNHSAETPVHGQRGGGDVGAQAAARKEDDVGDLVWMRPPSKRDAVVDP